MTALDLKSVSKGAYVGGQWVGSSDGRTFDVTDPATGETIATLPDLTPEDVARAIETTHAAFGQWRKVSPKERARILRRWNDLMLAHQPRAKSSMAPPSSNGLRKKGGAFTATSFPRRRRAARFSHCASRSASRRRSRRGIFPMR